MQKSSEFFLVSILSFAVGLFFHTVYSEHFESAILAPKGELRYEIRRALDETKKKVIEMNAKAQNDEEPTCDRQPPPQRKIRTKEMAN